MTALRGLLERLVTPHGLDRYLELVNPMLVRREIRGAVTDIRHQTAETVTITLRPSAAWSGFHAGQYVRVSVDIDGVRRSRCYSPACSQHRADGRIELTIKADGLVSRYLRNATPGMVVGMSAAEGEFTLPDQRPRRLLLVSGGSGITPVMSMVRTLSDEHHLGLITFLHYSDTREDALYQEELAELAAVNPNLTVAHVGTDADGFFTREQLRAVAPWYAEAETYLCGPPGLMDAVGSVYAEDGLSEHLHTEQFTPPPVTLGEALGQVRFSHSGHDRDNTGHTLLEQAEAAGLTPDHGCRMGICFSCTRVKHTGCVRDTRTGELHSEDGEEIQLCVSIPTGDVDIDL